MFANDTLDLDLRRLLDALLAEQRITTNAVLEALAQAKLHPAQHPLELIAALALPDLHNPGQALGLDTLCQWLAAQVGQPFRHIDPLQVDLPKVSTVMSAAFARRHGILALAVDANSVTVASAQPYQREWEADLAGSLGKRVQRVLASPLQIRQLASTFFGLAQSVSGADQQQPNRLGELEQLLELDTGQAQACADDAHIVHVVDWMLQYAIEQRASDIHLEPRREQGHLRLRIDGLLHSVYAFPAGVTLAMVSRLKHLGRMNVAEKRRPQDGRIKTKSPAGAEVELRLSTLPTAFGEKLVMRIFDPQVLLKGFDQLGLSVDDQQRWHAMTSQTNGIILVTGPTGSGKTSTLYSTLRQLATREVNLCTVEDPVEMVEPAFNQMQVQHNIDLTFAAGIRALLRQDPDIIMVGEIRDLETADIAIKAAQTGHLVLSTLHTNDAPATLTRMRNMGIPPFNIASSVILISAQRLARRLCAQCKAPVDIPRETLKEAGFGDEDLNGSWKPYGPVGCAACHNGYKGRVGIYEVMPISEAIQRIILADGSELEIAEQARREGVRSLRMSGLHKVRAGVTSLEEVLGVTNE